MSEPLFWYRPVCNGEMYEGPIHNNSVGGKMLRDEKPGEWLPLYAEAQAQAELNAARALLREVLDTSDKFKSALESIGTPISANSQMERVRSYLSESGENK